MPEDAASLHRVLAGCFEACVGAPLEGSGDVVIVPSLVEGGMSSGHVSRLFWREQALPLLLMRFGASTPSANDQCVDLSVARITLVSALAWRVVAELVRRHHADWHVDVRQIHPGASLRGLLEATWRRRDTPTDSHRRLVLNLGGPSGRWEAGECRGSLAELLAPAPAAVIDGIEAALGLPPAPSPMPATTAPVAALRLLAGLLEARAFAPTPWRTTQGWVGMQEDAVADWHPLVLPARAAALGLREARRLSTLVLLHPAEDEAPWLTFPVGGEALGIDLETGACCIAEAHGGQPLGSALQLYVRAGRSMPTLVAQVMARLAQG